MKGIVRRRDRARRDLIPLSGIWPRKQVFALPARFFVHAEMTFERLARMPHMGTRYEAENAAFAEVRYFPVSRFKKYLVFYLPTARGVDIVRVLHGARDIHTILAEEFGVGPGE